MRTTVLGSVVTLAALATTAGGQILQSTQETRGYVGIGRITWTLSKDLETIFAVPHSTAGPRILCKRPRNECEILVYASGIETSEKRRSQLEAAVTPLLQHATEKSIRTFYYGKDKSVIYTTLQESRPSQPFRFTTLGYAVKGPAVIWFEALTNDALDNLEVLKLVDAAKPVDALGMLALRFADYKAVCDERFPNYGAANEAALSSSPFSNVDVVRFVMGYASLAEEDARKQLDAARKSYAESFDSQPSARKQAFCENFPLWLTEAGKSLEPK